MSRNRFTTGMQRTGGTEMGCRRSQQGYSAYRSSIRTSSASLEHADAG